MLKEEGPPREYVTSVDDSMVYHHMIFIWNNANLFGSLEKNLKTPRNENLYPKIPLSLERSHPARQEYQWAHPLTNRALTKWIKSPSPPSIRWRWSNALIAVEHFFRRSWRFIIALALPIIQPVELMNRSIKVPLTNQSRGLDLCRLYRLWPSSRHLLPLRSSRKS